MKYVIYLVLVFLFLGCEKEDALTSKIKLENLYVIEDDPNNPVKHRIYDIYTQYGVPVYFNDTIGKVFVKTDVTGKDVYRYETLDLAWGFTSYSDVKYNYEYLIDPDEQLKALGIIEEYLRVASKLLYPFNFFVTKSATIVDQKDSKKLYEKGAYTINYRTVLMTGDWTEDLVASLPETMMREMVKSKILNYKDQLAAFNDVSDKVWYGEMWTDLDPHWYDYVDGTDKPRWYFSPSALDDSWFGVASMEPEELAEFRAAIRLAIGQFGFVSAGKFTSLSSPSDSETDLVAYISEMLNHSKAEFEKLWGNSPLVMENITIIFFIQHSIRDCGQ